MTNIIKRRKTADYTQINNFPVQEDIRDLASIGLLTYIMSLPADWTLHKTQLQSQFTRRKVDGAWKILVEKKYAIGFYAHVNGHKNYFYMVSDIAFTKDDFDDFVRETVEDLLHVEKASVHNILPIPDSPYKIGAETSGVQNVHQEETLGMTGFSPDVHNEQFSANCSDGATTKEIKTKETGTKETSFELDLSSTEPESTSLLSMDLQEPSLEEVRMKKLDTKKLLRDAVDECYTEFAIGRWSKKAWGTLTDKFITETIESGRYRKIEPHLMMNYVRQALSNIALHHDYKNGIRDKSAEIERQIEEKNQLLINQGLPPLFYNWLEERMEG